MKEIKRQAEELMSANELLRQSIGQLHKRTKVLNDKLQQVKFTIYNIIVFSVILLD